MTKEPAASQISRITLVTLIAIIALVLGGVAGGTYFAIQGLRGSTGKPAQEIADPWVQNGIDAAFVTAMIKRNEDLNKLADLVMSRSKNEQLLAFADDLKTTTSTWNFKLDSMLDEHGVRREAVQDTMSYHYRSIGQLHDQLKTIEPEKFDLRFVAGLNLITRMDFGNMKTDSASLSSADVKAVAEEMITYGSNIGPALQNWNK